MRESIYNNHDIEAAKIIDDFLPDKLFDAHMHITHLDSLYDGRKSFDDYYDDIKLFAKNREVRCNGMILLAT